MEMEEDKMFSKYQKWEKILIQFWCLNCLRGYERLDDLGKRSVAKTMAIYPVKSKQHRVACIRRRARNNFSHI